MDRILFVADLYAGCTNYKKCGATWFSETAGYSWHTGGPSEQLQLQDFEMQEVDWARLEEIRSLPGQELAEQTIMEFGDRDVMQRSRFRQLLRDGLEVELPVLMYAKVDGENDRIACPLCGEGDISITPG